ncbi:MAG: HDIG domain-containing protein [Sulfolobales archaeon]
MISRVEAINLLSRYLTNDKNLKHCISVEAIMRFLALRLGEDEELWGMTGLLHDIDYELVGKDLNKHGLLALELLKDALPVEALEAIVSHNELTGHTSETKISYALKAADHISGLIIATVLVMPNKKLDEVRVESVLKKFKQKDFAKGVNRSRILLCEKLGLSLEDFTSLSLEALKAISNELGL